MSPRVKTGLDLIADRWPRTLRGARVGLLVHPASVTASLRHAVEVFLQAGVGKVTALFGPQHGIHGETQDNMIEWHGFRDKESGMPIYSLYGEERKPTPLMLRDVDVMVVDLQDVGARYYTFIWTLDLCMQACGEMSKELVILDRPNPIGGQLTEGPVLDPAFSSFVGLRPLPVRHGMTTGEIGLYLAAAFHRSLDLHVVPMEGWRRRMWFDTTRLPWILPSPNMPTLDTATVYPGMCLLEGTLLSEGRGTTRPFEIFGAPWIDPHRLVKTLDGCHVPGVLFRPLFFEPTFQKHAGLRCGGAQIHVTDRLRFRPFKTAVAIVKTAHDLYPEHNLWRQPPYEYEHVKMPFDILAGTDRLRNMIIEGEPLERMEAWWNDELRRFTRDVRAHFLKYD